MTPSMPREPRPSTTASPVVEASGSSPRPWLAQFRQARALRRFAPGAPLQLAFALGVAALSVGCASSTGGTTRGGERISPADKNYEIAVGSFHNGMFDDAKVQLDAALKLDPEHADSHYLVGVIYLQEGKTIENALTYDRCLQDASAGLQRERARELHGQARTAFTRAAELYREGSAGRGRAQNSLAAISLYFEDHGRAVEEAKGALAAQFYPERFSALANLGWAYYGQGDLVQAMTELRQALLLNEDYCVGHYRLAQVYLDAGMDAEAADEAIKAVANPMCPIQDAFRVAGISHLRLGRTQEGAQALQSCVELAPRSCLASECAALVGHATVAQQP